MTLLAAMALQMLAAGRHASAVVDEPAHLAAGWLALTEGDWTVNREHPPFVKLLAALPLLALSPAPGEMPHGPRGSEDFAFAYSRELLYRANDADTLLRAARLPVILLTLAAGLALFLWTRAIAGERPAVLAVALFAFEPNLLAHGRLVTTDSAATLFVLSTAACLERALAATGKALRLRWGAAAGLCLGLGLLSRFSLALMIPLLAAMAALDPRRPLRARLGVACVVLLLALVVVNAAYGFSGTLFPLAGEAVAGPMLSSPLAAMEADAALRWMPLPVPRLWLEGLDLARYKNRQVEGPTYLNGGLSEEGLWSYFLLALGMKTTLPMLLLGVAGLALLARRGPRQAGLAAYILVPAVGLLALVTALTKAQIGLRYVLPVVPFLCIAGALAGDALLAREGRARLAGRALVIMLCLWHAGSALAVHPHHLAYMNALAGGPDRPVPRLVDSNLDWGQDLIGLGRFMEERGLDSINLYYFGTADPDYYGIRRNVPPRPGWFAVSVTHMMGVYLPDPEYLAPFRRMDPDATIGHSIRLYRLEEVPDFLRRPVRRGSEP